MFLNCPVTTVSYNFRSWRKICDAINKNKSILSLFYVHSVPFSSFSMVCIYNMREWKKSYKISAAKAISKNTEYPRNCTVLNTFWKIKCIKLFSINLDQFKHFKKYLLTACSSKIVVYFRTNVIFLMLNGITNHAYCFEIENRIMQLFIFWIAPWQQLNFVEPKLVIQSTKKKCIWLEIT